MSAPLRLVVFDVDGTLVDSRREIVGAMQKAFDTCGHVPPDEATMLSIVGLSLHRAMEELAPDLDAAGHEALVQAYRASYFSGGPVAPLFPGARDALDRLAAREEVLLGVATGKSRKGLDKVLGGHGLLPMFLTAQVADDHPSKPHPSMLHATLADTGAEAGSAVMVGDTEFDIQMGRAAGFATIGVTWGYHPPERLAAADVLIDDFAALDGALDGLWGR